MYEPGVLNEIHWRLRADCRKPALANKFHRIHFFPSAKCNEPKLGRSLGGYSRRLIVFGIVRRKLLYLRAPARNRYHIRSIRVAGPTRLRAVASAPSRSYLTTNMHSVSHALCPRIALKLTARQPYNGSDADKILGTAGSIERLFSEAAYVRNRVLNRTPTLGATFIIQSIVIRVESPNLDRYVYKRRNRISGSLQSFQVARSSPLSTKSRTLTTSSSPNLRRLNAWTRI